MRSIARVLGLIPTTLLRITFALLVFAPICAEADTDNCKFVGNTGYSYSGNFVVLTADQVANFDPAGISGNLRVELWALGAAYTGGAFSGYKLAQYAVGPLTSGTSAFNVRSGPVAFASPPSGTWAFVMLLTENVGAASNDGYAVVDWRNLAAVVIPHVGLWANPSELGSGYALDYNHGVLVVAIYSYTTTGPAQWYLAAGPVIGNTFTATLDKYVDGQCISCAYSGQPTLTGNDGMMTITFTSSTSATVDFPGGRVTQIQPFAF